MNEYSSDDEMYKAAAWGAADKIVIGSETENGTVLLPDIWLSRADMAVMLWRLAGRPRVYGTVKFTDVKYGGYIKRGDVYRAVLWITKTNIAKGYKENDGSSVFGLSYGCLKEHVITIFTDMQTLMRNDPGRKMQKTDGSPHQALKNVIYCPGKTGDRSMKLFDEIPYIEDDSIIIKKIEERDAAVIGEMSQNDNVRKYLPTFLFEYRFDDKREAVREMYGDIFRRKESMHLGIYLKNDPEIMTGIAEIYNYDPNWNKASIGLRINEEYWNKGIAGHAINLLKEYLFDRTDVKRITAHVISDNVYSCRAAERCGFRLRKKAVPEDWGYEEPVIVNKYVLEKLGNIKYKKIGNGPKTMVMLPGLALKSTLGSCDLIAENYSMFADYSIYLFDDRNNIEKGYTIRERAGDVAAEMKTLHLKGANVFGASMGGMVGQYLAIDHPDLVSKLVLSATCPCMNERSISVITRWRDLAAQGEIKKLVRESIRDIYSEKVALEYGSALEEGIGVVTDDEREKFIILSDALLGFDCRDELNKISCKVLVMGSEGDRVLGADASREIIKILGSGNCKAGVVDHIYGNEYGHGFYDEAPDHRQRILRFFEER